MSPAYHPPCIEVPSHPSDTAAFATPGQPGKSYGALSNASRALRGAVARC